MATVNRLEALRAWQKARLLSSSIHETPRDKTFHDDYDLKRQIRRSGGSVAVIPFIGNRYVTQTTFDQLYIQADEVSRIIDSLLFYLNNTDNKGRRYSKGNLNTD
ncbi:hypothetical protein GCM10027577_38200 [Spirosoma fluminis]